MEMTPLPHAHSGSNVTHWHHDAATNKLRVRFRTGKTAEYDNVTESEAAEFVAASSHGHHFSKHIKPKKTVWRYV